MYSRTTVYEYLPIVILMSSLMKELEQIHNRRIKHHILSSHYAVTIHYRYITYGRAQTFFAGDANTLQNSSIFYPIKKKKQIIIFHITTKFLK